MSKGFTLLEIIITLVILAAGVMAIASAFGTGIFASSDVEDTGLALNIAQAKMEEIKNMPFANLADSGPSADPNFSNFNVRVDVAEAQNPMQVVVTVAWNVKGGETSLALTTLVASY